MITKLPNRDSSVESGLSLEIDEKNHTVPFETLSSLCSEAIYIIDFKRQCFCYVSNHDLFLCGHSQEEVMRSGYDFYSKIIHPDDLSLLKTMYHIINLYILEQKESINYFSFTVRLKNYLQENQFDYFMVYHKLKPIYNQESNLGICTLTLSVMPDSGNLIACLNNNDSYLDEYSFISGKWKRQKNKGLTEKERAIIVLSKQGLDNKSIAGKLCISYDTLRHAITILCEKLGVKNLKQAVVYATNHLMLFETKTESFNKNVSSDQPPKKSNEKQRNKLTAEKLHNIQIRLNRGQSVNSIVKEENISRSSIRNAVKTGKLHINE
jgi:DNA-binding NarL/FixJ family response regulator